MFQRLIRQTEINLAQNDMPEPPALPARRRWYRLGAIRVRATRRKPVSRCSSSKCPPLFYLVVFRGR